MISVNILLFNFLLILSILLLFSPIIYFLVRIFSYAFFKSLQIVMINTIKYLGGNKYEEKTKKKSSKDT